MTEAVVYLPECVAGPGWRNETFRSVERLRWLDVLADYCAHRGYTVVAVCTDLLAALETQAEKPGRRIILGRLDWLPDLEIATMPITHSSPDPMQRRPHRRRPQILEERAEVS